MVRSVRRQPKQTIFLVAIFAATSIGFLAIAVTTNNWLNYMDDLLINSTASESYAQDGTDNEPKTYRVLMSSGLWRTCIVNGTDKGICRRLTSFSSLIDYKVRGTFAAPATGWIKYIYWLSFFHIVAMVTDIVAVLFFAWILLRRKEDHYIFISGFIFVTAGLLSMFGLLLYISGVNDELGDATLVQSAFDSEEPLFVYNWGWSFYLVGVGLTLSEISGFVVVHLYFTSVGKPTKSDWLGARTFRRISINGDVCRFKDTLRRMSSTMTNQDVTYVSHDLDTVQNLQKPSMSMDKLAISSMQDTNRGQQHLRPPRRSKSEPVVLSSFNKSFESIFKITSV